MFLLYNSRGDQSRSLVWSFAVALMLWVPSSALAQRVSFIYADNVNGVTADENARRWSFERMGFATRGDWAGNTQSWFTTYGANRLADAWYVPRSIDPTVLGDKMRLYQRGVVIEGNAFDTEFGVSATDGVATTGTSVTTLTAAHPVTANVGAGVLALFPGSTSLSPVTLPLALGASRLGDLGADPGLVAIDTGGALANTIGSTSVATGKRVRLPWGSGPVDYTNLSTNGLRLVEDALSWCAEAPDATGPTIVLVVDEDGVLSDQDRWRLRRLKHWNFQTILLWDGASQVQYDAAIAAADAVWIAASCDAADIGYKLREATCGVVSELAELDTELGYATSDGIYTNASWIYILDRSHPVSSSFSFAGPAYGYTLFHDFSYANNNYPGNNQPLARLQGTAAPDLRQLGTQWSNTTLAIVEAGDQLANSYNSSNVAAGPRVRLPWGGNALDIRHQLSWGDGARLLYDALRWASGANTGSLVAHYKLDEASGATTAIDSSPSGFDGAINGAVTLGVTPARRGLAARFDANGEYVLVPAKPELADLTANGGDVSIAFWVRPSAVPHSDWRNLFMIGGENSSDRGPLIMLHPNRRVHAWFSTDAVPGGEGRWTSAELDEDQWHHLCIVKSGQQLRWYVNGEFDGSHVMTGVSIATKGELRIGRQSWWGTPYADLDDVRVYDYPLSDQEVAELHADLILHLKLDETSGAVAEDSSVFGHDGEYRDGVTLGEPGAVDSSAEFDGVDDLVTVPIDVSETDHTSSLWFKTTEANCGFFAITNATPGDGNIDRHLWLSGGQVRCRTWSDETLISSVGGLNNGRWHHVAHSTGPGGHKLYVDGLLVATGSKAGSNYHWQTRAIIGCAWTPETPNRYFTGQIDDVRIYNRVLTDTEVFELGGSGLRLHLKLDETSGTVAEDSSPFGNDGTHVDMPTLGDEAIIERGAPYLNSVGWDRTELPHTVVDGLDEITVAWWMKTTKTGEQAILSGARSGSPNAFLVYVGNHQQLRLYVNESLTTWSVDAISDDRWRHYAMTYRSSDGAAGLYMDGELISTNTHPTRATLDVDPGGLMIGQEQDSVGGGFVSSQQLAATLDDFRIYGRVLSAEEVADLYGLVGHWRMDEITGDTVVHDETVFANDGKYDNAPTLEQTSPYPSPAVQTAVRFQPGQETDIPNDDHLELGRDNADFTVAYWLKSNKDYTGQWRETLKKHLNGTRRTPAMWLRPSDNRMHVRISTTHSWNEGTADTQATFDPGVWRHVAYVKQGSKLSIYVDGALDRSTTLNGTVVWNNGSLYWGARHPSQQSDVTIDDVRVYSRALNSWEIAELHGMVGRWKLSETSGGVAVDSSGIGNHGAYLSTPAYQQGLPALAEGPYGTRFSGGAMVQVDSTRHYHMKAGVAVAAWVYNEGGDDRFNILGSDLQEAVALSVTADHKPVLRLNQGLPAGYAGLFAQEGDRMIPMNAWRHVAASFDGSEVVYYLDGVEVDRHDATGLTLGFADAPLLLGQCLDSSVAGRLHDVRLYNRPIGGEEARALYYGEATPGLRITSWTEIANP
ncbi:LamG domain-containing protein [Botrimarina hoheduenensis]|uniref:Pentaxin family protein n=1 Tax=Botrimarina hoheduenensis TaxID=2528000 RepID=A0A5C5VS38_9BACT|nr:LamG domain-containing protein [Botrimarina hoheduenensis]TWT41418.1 Pentaxin family protein [Botrimarina hoheduenensis]